MDYKQIADQFNNTHSVNLRIFYELISQFPVNSKLNILDFGCGTGNYVRAMKRFTNFNVYGVEPCEEMISYAKANNPNTTIRKGNHEKIPYPDNFFDYVYMTNVVHHVEDLSLMYREIRRILKPNGVLCICTESRKQLLSKYWIRYFPSIVIKDLNRFPSIHHLISIARQQNLHILKTTQVCEKKWTYVTDFLINQITERSMSVLNLLSDAEYERDKKKILVAKQKKIPHLCLRGYTFLWLKKGL